MHSHDFAAKFANDLLAFRCPGIVGFQFLSDSLRIEHQILLCHDCHVVRLEKFLLLFVEVDQFLVQRLIEQLGTLQASLEIALLPEPILSYADVVQRIIDYVVE